MKKIINAMPRGNARFREFRKWERIGNMINRLNITRMNMNMKGRRVANQSNRTWPI